MNLIITKVWVIIKEEYHDSVMVTCRSPKSCVLGSNPISCSIKKILDKIIKYKYSKNIGYSRIAQLAEHSAVNTGVTCSNQVSGAIF